MHEHRRDRGAQFDRTIVLAAVLLLPAIVSALVSALGDKTASPQTGNVAVGPQYDTTHVYVAPADLEALVASLVATFGGKPSKRIVTNVLPVASSTQMQ